mgnify:CR=1 FL=1
MFTTLIAILASFRLAAATRRDMLFEIAALRQQLEIMRRSGVKPRFRRSDRRFWIWLVRNWPNWRHGVVILKPETIIRWHRDGYRRFWRFRSGGKPGRPRIPRRHIAFIKQISRENPAWGEDRIALEMKLKLGIELQTRTLVHVNVTRSPTLKGVQQQTRVRGKVLDSSSTIMTVSSASLGRSAWFVARWMVGCLKSWVFAAFRLRFERRMRMHFASE